MALEYKTVKETAVILKVHRNTIINWILNGTLKATKIGRKYLISMEEIQKKLDGGVINGNG